jgi:hypothetical protein
MIPLSCPAFSPAPRYRPYGLKGTGAFAVDICQSAERSTLDSLGATQAQKNPQSEDLKGASSARRAVPDVS